MSAPKGKPVQAGDVFLSDRERIVYDEAVRLAGMGIKILPIHSIRATDGHCTCGRNGKNGKQLCDKPGKQLCDKPGKHPISGLLTQMVEDGLISDRDWRKSVSSDISDINYWFMNKTYCNIAISCMDNEFLVLDFESLEKVYEGDNPAFNGMNGVQLFEFFRKKFPEAFETVIVRTGSGGYHVYFKQPQDEKIMTCKVVQPIFEIRSFGSYVVAPKSMHKTGNRYEYLAGHAFGQIPVKVIPPELLVFLKGLKASSSNGSELQVLPNEKADKFYYRGAYSIQEREKKVDMEKYGGPHTPDDIVAAEQWLSHFTTGKNKPRVGTRNDKAWSLACQLRDADIPWALAKTTILRYAQQASKITRDQPEWRPYTDNRAMIQLINAYTSEPRPRAEPQTEQRRPVTEPSG